MYLHKNNSLQHLNYLAARPRFLFCIFGRARFCRIRGFLRLLFARLFYLIESFYSRAYRQDTAARTVDGALHTAYAFVIIYRGKVVGKRYRALGTAALALAARYTADLANRHYVLALGRIGASDIDHGGLGYPADYLLGASRDARAARRAFIGIDFGRARILAYGDAGEAAGVHARAKPHTAVLASLTAAGEYLRALAVAEALIVVLIRGAVSARAVHDRHRRDARHFAHAKYLRDVLFVLGRSRVTARNIRLALEQCLCELRAASITATAAVGAREVALDIVDTRVALDRQLVAEVRQTKREQRGDRRHYEYWNYYS